jgi:lipid-binding SYLF domain-containing protein
VDWPEFTRPLIHYEHMVGEVYEGLARTLTSTTIQNDIYAFIFNQQGLMAGLGIQGSKITKTNWINDQIDKLSEL